MGRRSPLPAFETMLRWRDEEGLTHGQIAERINKMNRESGVNDDLKATVNSVAVAFSRNGATTPRTIHRFEDEVPWRVSPEHRDDYNLRQLRTWGRINAGIEKDGRRLAQFKTWERELRAHDGVVDYTPEGGFEVIKARPGVDTGLVRLTYRQIAKDPKTYRAWKKYYQAENPGGSVPDISQFATAS